MNKLIFVNLITSFRVFFSISLLFFTPFSIAFYILYFLCGASDMLDGFLARKLKVSTKFGEMFDTICDFIFFTIMSIIVLTNKTLFPWIYIWIIIIVILKIFNIIYSIIFKKSLNLPHTIGNKITGLLLFFALFFIFIFNINYLLIIICISATISAINEWFVIKNKPYIL